MPKANVIKSLSDKISIVLRPSGTEPELKVYLSINADNKEEALTIEKELSNNIATLIY